MNELERAYDRTPYETISIPRRPNLHWPSGARVAIAILVSCEYYEMQPRPEAFTPPNVPGGFGRAPYPDFRAFSQREYGNRVGVFRVLEALKRQGVIATAAIDAEVATRYPTIPRRFREGGHEIAGHGHSITNVICNRMSEAEESAYITSALDAVEKACGQRPTGWHGGEFGESERTPSLLARLGLGYVLDWPNDEQPFIMRTPGGELVSVAIALELDDVISLWHRRLSMELWRGAIKDALDQLLHDSASSGRHLVLNLHPWLIGHPYRITYLDEILADLRARKDVWIAPVSEIVSHYRAQTAV